MTDLVRCTVNGEFDIILPAHRAKAWAHDWEKPRLQAIREHITPGDIVYYVGAEEGDMPALCQMWGATVMMFEPDPFVWTNIKTVWDANQLTEPWTWVGFASSRNDMRQEIVRQGWPPCAHGDVITDHGFRNLSERTAAEVKIDSVTSLTGAPSLITFDVEGSEFEVLKGAEQTIEQHHPVIVASIHPEFMWEAWREYSRTLRNWIIGRGYNETLLEWDHEAHFLYEPL